MFHIAAIDHYLQPRKLTEFMPRTQEMEREIKERFVVELAELIQREQIGLVAEECGPNQDTIPRLLAERNNCAYCEIDMPLDIRRQKGIPDDYELLGEETKRRGYQLREDFMVSSTLAAWDSKAHVLVVIGREHSDGIAELLRAKDIQCRVRDFTAEPWFDPPFARMGRGEGF